MPIARYGDWLLRCCTENATRIDHGKIVQNYEMVSSHSVKQYTDDCFEFLFNELLFRKSSTVYQIFKELLDGIDLLRQRSEPSNRDIVKLKDLPTLVWQIINQPNLSAKIA